MNSLVFKIKRQVSNHIVGNVALCSYIKSVSSMSYKKTKEVGMVASNFVNTRHFNALSFHTAKSEAFHQNASVLLLTRIKAF